MRQIVKHPITYNLDYETVLKSLTGDKTFQIGEILLLAKKGEEKLIVRSGDESEKNYVDFIPKAKIVEMLEDVTSGASIDLTELKERLKLDEQKIVNNQSNIAAGALKLSNLSGGTISEVARLDDRIDTVATGSVKDVKYDSGTQYVYLERGDGTTTDGFNASVFVKDGMLSAVTYDSTEHTMTFIWNTDAGHQSITVDLDDIIAAYKGDGETIEIDDNVVSVILDETNGAVSYNAYKLFSGNTIDSIKAIENELHDFSGATVDALNALASGATKSIQELSAATVSEFATLRSDAETSAKTLNDKIDTLSGNTVNAISTLSANTVNSINTLSANTVNNISALRTDTEASAKTLDTKINNLSSSTVSEIARIDGLVDALESGTVKDVRYNSATKYLYIERQDGTVTTGFDASVFIKDGMLSAVTYDSTEHTMTFIWNTDAGHQSITVDLDDIIAAYTGDNETIKIENNVVSAIVDEANGLVSYNSYKAFSGTTTQNISNLSAATVNFSAATVSELTALRSDTENSASTLYHDIEAVKSGSSEDIKNLSAATVSEVSRLDDKIDELSAATVEALEGLDSIVSGSSVADAVKVTIKQENGKITEVDVESKIDCGTFE